MYNFCLLFIRIEIEDENAFIASITSFILIRFFILYLSLVAVAVVVRIRAGMGQNQHPSVISKRAIERPKGSEASSYPVGERGMREVKTNPSPSRY